MNIVVVLELDEPSNVRILNPDRTPADPQHPVRRAHAVPIGGSGVCGPLTLCGLDTDEMTLAPHRPADPGQPWWPPSWHACSLCQSARQNTPPPTDEPADAHLPEAAPAAG